ncbi:MAG: molybdopterin molybdotransferase MoeA [SAR324 cluster bacterium]|nr:molybdopterin molybdotransferase MoeA [SAR324 cluster bacterium]
MTSRMKRNTFQQSLHTVLAHSHPLAAEQVSFHEGLGRVLAADVAATQDDPPAPKSAMDGFALRAADTREAGAGRPVTLMYSEVVGAGHLARGVVRKGRAMRLMTGALLPKGADAVVKQEDTLPAGEGAFAIMQPLVSGENVVPAGARMKKDEIALHAGEVISPQGLGLLASLNRNRLNVVRRPRVALLALGDELVELGQPLQPGQLHVSNLYALEAKVAKYGGQPRRLGIAGDNPDLILRLLRPRLPDPERLGDPLACEMLLTLGGSHGGDFDFAQHVLEALGAKIQFRRTRLSLGGSTLFATLGRTLLFGLPGTPVPSLGAFELLVRPALWRLAGRTELAHPRLMARLTAPVSAWNDATCFSPGWLRFDEPGAPTVTPLRDRGVSGPRNGVLANALIEVPEGAEGLMADQQVSVQWLGD